MLNNTINRRIIYGILLIVIPFVIMVSYAGYHYYTIKVTAPKVTAQKRYDIAPGGSKSYSGLVINHPPKDFLHPTAQIMIGFGTCISSICWGIAKLIKAIKDK
ncbi:hypothetical protein M0R04_16140 [Candidatus Dojkabacteria bacterium]|nr:hypothetical protein [Candidatus Dojkabacteria bacterium]